MKRGALRMGEQEAVTVADLGRCAATALPRRQSMACLAWSFLNQNDVNSNR
jgi:hypothetical protein